jgi:hypothetical protein
MTAFADYSDPEDNETVNSNFLKLIEDANETELSRTISIMDSGVPIKLYYCIHDGNSYTFEQMLVHNEKVIAAKREIYTSKGQTFHFTSKLTTPKLVIIPVFPFTFTGDWEKFREEMHRCIVLYLSKYCFYNQSVIYQDTICTISQEPFTKPYILNITGRTYNFDAIMTALNEAASSDTDLITIDGVITPTMMSNRSIVLYPNLMMWPSADGDSLPIYTFDVVKYKPFDQAKIQPNAALTHFIENPPNNDTLFTLLLELTNTPLSRIITIGDNTYVEPTDTIVIKNLEFANTSNLFSKYFKQTRLRLHNCYFEGCDFHYIPRCIKFFSCKFKGCIGEFDPTDQSAETEFVNCNFTKT